MFRKSSVLSFFKSPWVIALLLLGIFLSTTSYKYGWDDQHLEIPLLKHLIDGELYSGDYYVESLVKNFSSFFYPLLAKIITVEQIPAVYFFLYLISRYFLFFWIYKLWLLLSKNSIKAFSCVAAFILIVRVPEFLYRTFSHQEFALAIIFAGIYYFFKERYLLAAFILGIAANFHALYSLFPMFYMGIFLLFSIKEKGVKPLAQSSVIFLTACIPFIYWTLSHRFLSSAPPIDTTSTNWLELFILACPQNFIFPSNPTIAFKTLISNPKILFEFTDVYTLLILLYFLNFFFNSDFRKNKKAIYSCLSAFSLIILCLIFTYFHPVRLMIDLNLARNSQFLLFLLIGFTTLTVFKTTEENNPWFALIIAALYPLYRFGTLTGIYVTCALFCIFIFLAHLKKEKNWLNITIIFISLFITGLFITLLSKTLLATNMSESHQKTLMVIFGLLLITTIIRQFIPSAYFKRYLSYLLILVTLGAFLIQFTDYKNKRVTFENKGGGFWQLQRNWEDMQHYVRKNTPKDAMILVPYNMEMGGFRILSERKIICSYRDCGIIGFDYQAAVEWQQRVKDIEPYKVMIKESPLPAIQKAVVKYNADYIVFMNYAAPKTDNPLMKKIYHNGVFTLFEVKR